MEGKRERYNRYFANRFLKTDYAGVLIVDNDFRIVEISDMLCSMLYTKRSIWLDRPAEELFEKTGWTVPPMDRSLLRGCIFRNRTVDWSHKGRVRSLTLDGDILLDDRSGGIVGAYLMVRDVSELIMLEEQVRQSDRLKTIGQIAAGTAHEIRNPLTAIRGFMQLMGKTLKDRSMLKEGEYVKIMMSELDRVNELVNEFLLLSKPKEIKLALTTIGTVLKEILPVIQNEALLHGISVHHESNPALRPVWIDKEQLKQVMLNLSKNAIEAMRTGGTLTIRETFSSDKPAFLAIVVQDTGPGIPRNVIERIFDPFFTTKQQGTGLGLAICQKIVHDMGGQLEVSSSPAGASFTVWLPMPSAIALDDTDAGGAATNNGV